MIQTLSASASPSVQATLTRIRNSEGCHRGFLAATHEKPLAQDLAKGPVLAISLILLLLYPGSSPESFRCSPAPALTHQVFYGQTPQFPLIGPHILTHGFNSLLTIRRSLGLLKYHCCQAHQAPLPGLTLMRGVTKVILPIKKMS